MPITVITNVSDVTRRGDNRPWTFRSVLRRGDDGGIVTSQPRVVYPSGGVLEVTLDPGPVIIEHDKKLYPVTVPEMLNDGEDLWTIIEAAVAFPPETSQQLLNAAVANAAPGFIAAELESQTAGAVTANLVSRAPQVIPGTTPGTVRNKLGDAVGPEFPAVLGLYKGLAGKPTIDPRDYAEGVGIGNDDTDAVLASAAEAGEGGTVLLPSNMILTCGEVLEMPLGSTLAGPGLNRWAPGGARLLFTEADARLKLVTNCQVRNLLVDGGFDADWGIYFDFAHSIVISHVSVIRCKEMSYVFDRTQNSILSLANSRDTPIGFGFFNGAAIIEVYGGSYDNSANSGAGYGGADARAILLDNDTTDPKMNGSTLVTANREITFYGGIYERGPCAHHVEILKGQGSVRFMGTQIGGGAGTTSIMHVGPDFTGDVVMSDLEWAFNGGTDPKLVDAEAGRIKYRNVKMTGGVGRNLISKTRIRGTATVYYDEQSRTLIDSNFDTGKYAAPGQAWTNTGTGVGNWNSTKKCLEMTLPNASSGVYAFLDGYQYYGEQYRVVTIRFRITNATGPVRLSAGKYSGGWITIGDFGNGSHEVVYEFAADEARLAFFSTNASQVTADLMYLRCEHGGENGGLHAIQSGTTIPDFNLGGADTPVTRPAAGRMAVGGRTLAQVLITAFTTLDFPSVAAGSHQDLTVAVPGALGGDAAFVAGPATTGIIYTARVSANDTVTVRAHNYTSGAIDPASNSFKVSVLR